MRFLLFEAKRTAQSIFFTRLKFFLLLIKSIRSFWNSTRDLSDANVLLCPLFRKLCTRYRVRKIFRVLFFQKYLSKIVILHNITSKILNFTKMTYLKECLLCLKSPSSSLYHIIYKQSYMKASFDFLIDYRKKLRTIAAIKKVEIVLFHSLEEKKIS